MNQDVKGAWLAALRSGEYQQGRGQLRDQSGRMCCLGVLCDLHHKAGLGAWHSDGWYGNACDLPPDFVVEWADLPDDNPEIGDTSRTLAIYNDGEIGESYLRPHTFAEIADLIEAHL